MKNLGSKIILILAVIASLALLFYRIYEGQHEAVALQKDAVESAITPVALTSAKQSEATDTITLPGTVEGWFEAPIYARVEGYVKAWYKDYGAIVKKGDVLAELTTPDLDAEYQQALADLESERAKNALAQLTAQPITLIAVHRLMLLQHLLSIQQLIPLFR